MQTFPWRKNIIIVIGGGYLAVLIVFGVLAYVTPKEAFGAIEGPLMALIGGSLAVAKDLVDSPSSEKEDTPAPSNKGPQDNG